MPLVSLVIGGGRGGELRYGFGIREPFREEGGFGLKSCNSTKGGTVSGESRRQGERGDGKRINEAGMRGAGERPKCCRSSPLLVPLNPTHGARLPRLDSLCAKRVKRACRRARKQSREVAISVLSFDTLKPPTLSSISSTSDFSFEREATLLPSTEHSRAGTLKEENLPSPWSEALREVAPPPSSFAPRLAPTLLPSLPRSLRSFLCLPELTQPRVEDSLFLNVGTTSSSQLTSTPPREREDLVIPPPSS